jgi:predicted negative regulator of RcsB-dependent stress response
VTPPRPDSRQATETLQEIESVFDRLARWAAENPQQVLAILGAILAVAAAVSIAKWHGERRETRASAAVARVQGAYLDAMGATPGSFELMELANPEAAKRVRLEYIERFGEVADQHGGTAAGVSARLQVASLQEQIGESEAALASLESAAREAAGGSALRGLALVRLGRALEARTRWEEAAQAYEKAGGIEAMPTRIQALGDAARCFAEAGDAARAVAIFERIENEAPDAALPAHVRARLRELQFQSRGDAAAAADE